MCLQARSEVLPVYQLTADEGVRAIGTIAPERLFDAEAAHRMSNLLQMVVSSLGRQTREFQEQSVRDALTTASRQIVAVAALHRTLDPSYRSTPNDLAGGFEDLCRHIESVALAPLGHELTFLSSTSLDRLPSPQALHLLRLMITELVVNCAKHAFPANGAGRVMVHLSLNDGQWLCEVSDNGIGLLSSKNDLTYGLAIVQQLAAEAGGSCRWSSGTRGTIARIQIPGTFADGKPP